MREGDIVIWHKRFYVLCGIDPMGLSERSADLEDVETQERISAPVAELEEANKRNEL